MGHHFFESIIIIIFTGNLQRSFAYRTYFDAFEYCNKNGKCKLFRQCPSIVLRINSSLLWSTTAWGSIVYRRPASERTNEPGQSFGRISTVHCFVSKWAVWMFLFCPKATYLIFLKHFFGLSSQPQSFRVPGVLLSERPVVPPFDSRRTNYEARGRKESSIIKYSLFGDTQWNFFELTSGCVVAFNAELTIRQISTSTAHANMSKVESHWPRRQI